jgi:hypothetical protein
MRSTSTGARRILVTGSARLDLYRHGGDSLQGRYHYLRLHPFSVAELGMSGRKDFQQLLALGGFPEPFLSGSKVEARRWSREYRSRLVTEDVASLEDVQDLGRMELLVLRLPQLVGAALSLNALREDLEVSHRTVSRWFDILERLYAVFRLPPFGAPGVRAVRKARKHHHFDWSLVPDEAGRFENLVASHLLKWVHFQQDTQGRDVELRYLHPRASAPALPLSTFAAWSERLRSGDCPPPILLRWSLAGGQEQCSRPGKEPRALFSRREKTPGFFSSPPPSFVAGRGQEQRGTVPFGDSPRGRNYCSTARGALGLYGWYPSGRALDSSSNMMRSSRGISFQREASVS